MGSFSSLSDLHLRPSLRLPPSPTPTPPSLLPFLPSCSIQSMPPRRRTAFPAASWALEDHIRSSLFQRRSLLLVGLSSLARSPLKAGASEVSVPGMISASLSGEDIHREAGSSLVALLKGIGIIGLGILGGLYALSRLENEALKTTTRSKEAKLREKEVNLTKMEQAFDGKLLKEREEKSEKIKKAKQKQASLSKELAFANSVMAKLQRELQDVETLAQELVLRINQIQSGLVQANELEATIGGKGNTVEVLLDKINSFKLETKSKEMNLESLKSALSNKETNYDNYASILDNMEEELTKAISKIEELDQDASRYKGSVKFGKAVVDDFKEQAKMVLAERDEYINRLHLLEEEFIDFKAFFKGKTGADLNLLSEKDFGLAHIQVKLDVALKDGEVTHMQLSDSENERDNLTLLLKNEIENVKCLNDELQLIKGTLAETRLEIPNLLTRVEKSKGISEDLSSDGFRITSSFIGEEKSLTTSLDEAKMSSKMLSNELCTAKDTLNETRKELYLMSDELKIAKENCENLKVELLNAHKKAETSAEDLKEERKVVSSLDKELEAFKKQLAINAEARRNLEGDLEEATKALNEMNSNALLISKEFEAINCRSANIEAENARLYKSLSDQRDASREASENLEDAQNLISRLGKERETLDGREKKLEEELALAKGEILRLRRTISATGPSNKDQPSDSRTSSRRKKRRPTSGVLD